MVLEDFSSEPSGRWRHYLRGGGSLETTGRTLRFVNRDTISREYTDAQIDDYQGLSRRDSASCRDMAIGRFWPRMWPLPMRCRYRRLSRSI